MTASLVATRSGPHPNSADLRIPVARRGFAPSKRPTRPWRPAADETRVLRRSKRAKSSPETKSTPVHLLDPIDSFGRQLETRLASLQDTVSAYDNRISVLEEQAYAEGYFLNSGSKEALQVFFGNNPLIRLSHLALLENGNLRAVWKGADASHIGLQFLNNGLIQYVLFKRRRANLPVSRACGRDTPRSILKQVSAFQLDEILYS